MVSSIKFPAALFLAFALTNSLGLAHEVKEMTARARVFENRVELIVTVSAHMAGILLAPPNTPVTVVTPEALPELKKRLEAQAKSFCTVLSGGKQAVAPSSVDVIMGSAEELSFYLAYPAVEKSPMRFEMTVLDRIEEGNAVTLEVLDARRKNIGSKQLKRGDTFLEISLPSNIPPQASE